MKPGGNQFAVKARVTAGGPDLRAGLSGRSSIRTPRAGTCWSSRRVAVKALDVSVKPNLSVGYVMGVGDEVPAALEQLGVKLTMITPDELAWGDLSKYDVIMTGVRAYERRTDLRAYNQRLLDYAKAGGTVIVQYNKFEFNDAQYGPYRGEGRPRARHRRERRDEAARSARIPCSTRRTASAAPTGPTGSRSADCISWTRRGRDPQYKDLIEFTEPFRLQPGRQARRAGRGQGRAGPVAVCRLGLVAPAPGGHGRCIPPDGESAEPALSEGCIVGETSRLLV